MIRTEKRIEDALLLEYFDIRGLAKYNPEQKIGVSVSSIYTQIAKFSNNPSRKSEIQLLIKALDGVSDKKHVDSRYTVMQVQDVIKCFDKYLKASPKSTFIQLVEIEGKSSSITNRIK